jgi:hypothetical protein
MIIHDSPNNLYATCYLHLSSIVVGDGVHVNQGTQIGVSGAAGADSPHLHFELLRNVNGSYVPVDPYGWQGAGTDPYETLNSYPAGINSYLWGGPQPPPSVTTNPATNVGQTSATFNASVNPNGSSTTLYFDYGATTSYGLTATYGNIGAGTGTLALPYTISTLSCGTTYHYRARAVNSGGTSTGGDQSFTTSTCIRNDACANATLVSGSPYSSTADTTAASTEPGDPTPSCGDGHREKSVWYSFTAPSSGTITADTFGSSYDTILSVYTGSCGAFTAVGCNDDFGRPQSQVSFQATAGATYFFMVTAYFNDGGNLVFNLTTSGMPNLAPVQPVGWSDKIVVSNVTGTNTDSNPLSPTDTLYVDFAVVNNGDAATAARFITEMYVDGMLYGSRYTDPPLSANYYMAFPDYSIGSLAAGTHTLRIKADATGTITESDESDNEYTKTIAIVYPCASLNCDDGNPCTDDRCDPSTGCVYTNNTAPCNDSNACTPSSSCQNGTCVGSGTLNCNDNNLCTDDTCNPSTGCVHTNNTLPCASDSNPCTDDVCGGGQCTHSPAVGRSCNDSNACTYNDTCNSSGVCAGTSITCTDDQCNTRTCNGNANCTVTPKTGTACNDGKFCTVNDVCSNGTCRGTARDCTSLADQCNDAVCNESAGQCVKQPKPNGSLCDDRDACTTASSCQNGACVGTPVTCDACQACNSTSGCTGPTCTPAVSPTVTPTATLTPSKTYTHTSTPTVSLTPTRTATGSSTATLTATSTRASTSTI